MTRPSLEPPPLLTGRVARVVAARGFCFIRGVDGRDYFAHYTEMRDLALDDLQPGEELAFFAVETPKGLRATDVQRVSALRQGSVHP